VEALVRRPNAYQAIWLVVVLACAASIIATCHSGVGFRIASMTQDSTPRLIVTKGEKSIADPIIQRLIYRATEVCLGQAGHLEDVEWRTAEAIYSVTDQMWCRGLWVKRDTGERLIILDEEWAFSASVMTHESIHDITGLPDPLPEEIREKCEYAYKPGG